jgi:hypothetical protein
MTLYCRRQHLPTLVTHFATSSSPLATKVTSVVCFEYIIFAWFILQQSPLIVGIRKSVSVVEKQHRRQPARTSLGAFTRSSTADNKVFSMHVSTSRRRVKIILSRNSSVAVYVLCRDFKFAYLVPIERYTHLLPQPRFCYFRFY